MTRPEDPISINLARITARLLNDPRGWRVDSLKEELKIANRTYRKYRKLLQDRLEPFIARHGQAHIVEIEDGDSKYIRLMEVDEPEENKRLFFSRLITLHLAQEMFAFLEGTEFHEAIGDIYLEARHRVKDKPYILSFILRNLDSMFHFSPGASKNYSGEDETLKAITKALLFCHPIRLSYKPAVEKPVSHLYEPLSLILHKNALFFVARHPESKKHYTFLVDRIESIEVQKEKFEYPGDFHPSNYCDGLGEDVKVVRPNSPVEPNVQRDQSSRYGLIQSKDRSKFKPKFDIIKGSKTMKDFLVSEDVIPIGEFKKHASRLLRRVKDLGRPILITQNGSTVSVVVSPQEYDQMREWARHLSGAEEGLKQSEEGNVISSEELDKDLDSTFGSKHKAKTR
jgi:prevent-host-death family protein